MEVTDGTISEIEKIAIHFFQYKEQKEGRLKNTNMGSWNSEKIPKCLEYLLFQFLKKNSRNSIKY